MQSDLANVLSALSVEELAAHIEEAQGILERKRADARRSFIDETKRKAKALGISLKDILSDVTVSNREARTKKDGPTEGRKVLPKYHDPDNPMAVWSGRGMQPKWVRAKLEAGSTLDDLLISPNL